MKQMWDERYGQKEFVYGTKPNSYFKAQLDKLTPGKILLPAEGEGRNAVYAATRGWQVLAFDMSVEGKNKAEKLAAKNNVSIQYKVGELEKLEYEAEQFDVLVLIYAHFPPLVQTSYHQKLGTYVKSGGLLILEGFSKNHLQLQEGSDYKSGPRDINMLFSTDQIKKDFSNFEIIELKEEIVNLEEGIFHKGESSVVRFVGRKR